MAPPRKKTKLTKPRSTGKGSKTTAKPKSCGPTTKQKSKGPTKPRSQRRTAATTSSNDGNREEPDEEEEEEEECEVERGVEVGGKSLKAHGQDRMATDSAEEDESDEDCPSNASPDTHLLGKFSVFIIILYLMYLMLIYFIQVKKRRKWKAVIYTHYLPGHYKLTEAGTIMHNSHGVPICEFVCKQYMTCGSLSSVCLPDVC